MKNIIYYPSNINGTEIKNAITGNSYNKCYVGSKKEKNFFRVIDSTGNYDNDGVQMRGNVNPNKLFFESYDEFLKYYKLSDENIDLIN